MLPRGTPGPIRCGNQSISQRPRPAATLPSSAMANQERYSPASIFRATQERKASLMASSVALSRWPISQNMARGCPTMISTLPVPPRAMVTGISALLREFPAHTGNTAGNHGTDREAHVGNIQPLRRVFGGDSLAGFADVLAVGRDRLDMFREIGLLH